MFTINNYTEDDVKLMHEWKIHALTMVVTKEIGEEKKTPHLQGFIGFKGHKRAAAVKKMHPTAHWELARAKDASMYPLKKDSEVIININNKQQGKRSDIHNLIEAVEKGATMEDLWQDHKAAMIKYHKGVEEGMKQWKKRKVEIKFKLEDFCEPPLDLKMPTVLHGTPGIGKTQFALAHFKNPLVVSHMDDLLFFTSEHDGIIFDDMDFKHLPRSTRINLVDNELDRSIHVRYKVARIPAFTKKIFTTNNYGGNIFKPDDNPADEAIDRRITVKEVIKLFG